MESGPTRHERAHDERSVLSARGICVEFEGLKALSDVEVLLGKGQILGLIGPNGAGKTTLVNVLTGFQRPSSGSIRIRDQEFAGRPARLFAHSGVVRTFQAVRLFNQLTVRENVQAAAIATGRPRREIDPLVDEIMEWFGCNEYRSRLAGTLPYSVQRRLGIARAMATIPDFLLLDEPAAGMNATEWNELAEIILGVPKNFGSGVLLIEHNIELIALVCDEVTVLDAGRNIASGSPEEVMSNPVVHQAYLGMDH